MRRYVAHEEIAREKCETGTMKETKDERKKSEGILDRENVSATVCRLTSKIQTWLLRRIGDVQAARNKTAGGWTNGGGKARRTGKKRRKVEKRREYRHAPIIQCINHHFRIFFHGGSFSCASNDDTHLGRETGCELLCLAKSAKVERSKKLGSIQLELR